MAKVKHYTSTEDMPIYNWFKINETSDVSYMLVNRGQMGNKEVLKKAFENIYSQYIDEFGINESYLKILELERNIILLYTDMALTKNLSLQNFIDMAEMDLSKSREAKKSNPRETVVYVEKHMGFPVNEHTTSVSKFYNYLKVMQEDALRK